MSATLMPFSQLNIVFGRTKTSGTPHASSIVSLIVSGGAPNWIT